MDSELTLDAVDRRILAALQQQGRMTFDELAAQVQLSASAVLRRVRRLEDTGVIAGYAAIVPPHKVGLKLSAFVEVKLHRPLDGSAAALVQGFCTAVQAWSEVVECVCLSHGQHYWLRVVVQDMAHYGRFMNEKLLAQACVQDSQTRFLLDSVKVTHGALS